MKKFAVFIACFVVLSLLPVTAFADFIEIGPEADSQIYQDNPNFNYGLGQVIWVDTDGSYTQRILMRFNLSGIPANAIINSASLQLWGTSYYYGTNFPINSHRATQPWDESTVTWNSFGNGSSFDPAVNSQAVVTSVETWHAWDLINLVKAWISGQAPNYGVVLSGATPGLSANFYSKDTGYVSNRPKLAINYTVPPPPPPAPKKKKVVATGFHKAKCKNKAFHAKHCKVSSKLKKDKRYKKLLNAAKNRHKKKCSKMILV